MAIVKVQIPLYPRVTWPALVYEEDKRNVVTQSIPRDVAKAISDTRKGYFNATWLPEKAIYEIHEQTDDQPW